jgi:hypothetical protein
MKVANHGFMRPSWHRRLPGANRPGDTHAHDEYALLVHEVRFVSLLVVTAWPTCRSVCSAA